MTSHFIAYAFLFIALGAMLYVVGIPWVTPKSHNAARKRPQDGVNEESMV